MTPLRELKWVGASEKDIKSFPDEALDTALTNLHVLMTGGIPTISKTMKGFKPKVHELRIWDKSGTYRVVYTYGIKGYVVVLHCFKKTSEGTLQKDIKVIEKRLKEAKAGD